MWAKFYRDFPHFNQETNATIKSYHYFLKIRYLCDKARKCGRRMDWLIGKFLCELEPYYKNRDTLK